MTLLVLLLALPTLAANTTDTTYYGDKQEGWFFYRDPRDAKNQPAPDAPKPAKPLPIPDELKPYTVKWLQKNMNELREKAIENPDDPKAVRDYMYAVRVTLDKAQNFANAARTMSKLDPNLDEDNLSPTGDRVDAEMRNDARQAQDQALAIMREKGGLFFFFHSECIWCHKQYEVIRKLAGTYKFSFRAISVDNKPMPNMPTTFWPDNGFAKRLGLTITPSLVYVIPPSTYAVISQGYGSVSALSEKLVEAGKHFKMLPQTLISRMSPMNDLILSTEDLRALSKDTEINPDKLNTQLRTRMESRMNQGKTP